MDGIPRFIALAAVAAVSLVLLAGLWNMLRGTNPNLSQTLMRWRVGLQFLAVVIMMVLVYLFR
jgi:hypoxia induced protein